jgi:uncharacterized protein
MRILALFLALLLNAAAWAQDVLPVPPLSGRVIDQTATLSADQKTAIETKLADFESQAGPQIVVLLVPATAPEDIAAYAQRVADSWKIGRRNVGDGLLLVVAKNERAVRIEVAKALEGAVPDLAARQIIDRAIVPAFKTGDYAGGLNAGLDQLMARIRGENLPAPQPRGGAPHGASNLGDLGLAPFIVVFVVGSLLAKLLGRKLGSLLSAVAAAGLAWWMTASLLLAIGAAFAAVILVGVLGIGGALRLLGGIRMGGGGGGGGGGFSSGGGGDFGGGGASGRW